MKPQPRMVVTVVCPTISDEKGRKVGGCGMGWSEEWNGLHTKHCPRCGNQTLIHGRFQVYPLWEETS